MVFIQYYYGKDKDWQSVLGDRGIVILDGRNSVRTMKEDAVRFNGFRRPVFDGFQIFKGESLCRNCRELTPIISLRKGDRKCLKLLQ